MSGVAVLKSIRSTLVQVQLTFQRRFRYSTAYSMQNAYILYPSGAERFELSFHYINESIGIDRKFTFNRMPSETISNVLSRIQGNVEKIVLQKHAKRRKKAAKKSNGEEEDYDPGPTPQVTVELLRGGNPVPSDETCQSFLDSKELLMLSLSGKKYNVVVNPPWVGTIQLPKSILATFPVYPSRLTGSNWNLSESIFLWYTKLPNANEWREAGSGYLYTPGVGDINHFLKVSCQPKKDMISGPVIETVSSAAVEAGPGECPFELRHAFTKERTSGHCFRVMSYNILAGMYSDTDAAKNELFAHCPQYALDIDYRKQLLMKEILGYNADIMCLQEVDEHVFEYDLQPILSMQGYQGVFNKKGSVREGLACIVNTNRFRVVESHASLLGAELCERTCYQTLWSMIKNNEALLERVKDRGTTSQATVLQSVDNPKKWLVVGNTHLYFHPDADHIRLLQGGQTILFIEDIVKKVQEENPESEVSVILCGDFNSTPECGIFQLMTTGFAPDDLADWKSNESEQICGLSLSQPFKLGSACGTPLFTNYTVGFSGCLDYIFYQTNTMHVKEVLPLYSEEELQKYTALPNIVFPSDHVALVSVLEWS